MDLKGVMLSEKESVIKGYILYDSTFYMTLYNVLEIIKL